MQTALGFRTHSGWAAVIAIGLSGKSPVVCNRQMVVLADPEIHGSKQPYHCAEPMPLPKAKEYLKQCTNATQRLATASMTLMIRELTRNGHDVVSCAILSGSGRMKNSVEEILASHPAIHTAEGELYRNAIAYACERHKLPLTRVREKEALEAAEEALGFKASHITDEIMSLGRSVGPPWSQDQKLAALIAWIAVTKALPHRHRKAVAS